MPGKRDLKKFPVRGNKATDDMNDALWWAACEGKSNLVQGALTKGWELVRDPFDVEKGDPYADIEYQRDWADPKYETIEFGPQDVEKYKSTALHRAAIFDQAEIAFLLIEAGWNPSHEDKDGCTPVDDAYAVGSCDLALYIKSKEKLNSL